MSSFSFLTGASFSDQPPGPNLVPDGEAIDLKFSGWYRFHKVLFMTTVITSWSFTQTAPIRSPRAHRSLADTAAGFCPFVLEVVQHMFLGEAVRKS
jgi:hypothetical protein